jgi:hypothetical protein
MVGDGKSREPQGTWGTATVRKGPAVDNVGENGNYLPGPHARDGAQTSPLATELRGATAVEVIEAAIRRGLDPVGLLRAVARGPDFPHPSG